MSPISERTQFTHPVKKMTLAEQMAGSIRESILSGELPGGSSLPTEPELAEQFGVSRAVVRDATRILMAQGLVEVQQGRGVFVTHPENEAFGEALLLALRRAGATAWDVEQFEQVLFPEVIALAASSATDEEIAEIRLLANEYIRSVSDHHQKWWHKDTPPAELSRFRGSFFKMQKAIFAATHNQVIAQLARPLFNLRNLRNWADSELDTPEAYTAMERYFVMGWVEAIAGRDPAKARQDTKNLMALPSEAIQAMRRTPVGEVAVIPVPPPLLGSAR
jgi:DNA-binding FadR family transcriptional regulator